MRVQWTGKSGRVYDCDLQPINSIFEEVGGVYILCKPSQSGGPDGIEVFVTQSFCRCITDQVTDLLRRFPEATHVALIPFDNDAEAEYALSDLTL